MGALIADNGAIRTIDTEFEKITADVAGKVAGFSKSAELHGYDVFQGKREWKNVPAPVRVEACNSAIRVVAEAGTLYVLRGIDIGKQRRKYSNPYDPHQLAMFHALETVQEKAEQEFSGFDVMAIADDHHAAMDSRSRFAGLKQSSEAGYSGRALTKFLDAVYLRAITPQPPVASSGHDDVLRDSHRS